MPDRATRDSMPPRDLRPDQCSSCEPCAGARPRREFLLEAGWIVASLAGALGVAPARAAALSVELTSALRKLGEEITYAIPSQDGAMLDREHDVILARDRGAIIAFSLFCPHQRTRLKWNVDARHFQCPKHKSVYLPDGNFVSGRATRGMDRCAIRRAADTVVVDPTRVFEQDKDSAGWEAAVVRL